MKNVLRTALAVLAILVLSIHDTSAFAFRNISPGEEVPDFTLPSVAGEDVSLSSYNGKVVVVLFWASDTDSKRDRSVELLRVIESIFQEHADKGVTALSINFDKDGREGTADLIKQNGITVPALLDETGTVYGSYGVFILPSVAIVNKDGTLHNAFGYGHDVEKTIMGEVEVLLGLKSRAELEGELNPEEVIEKPDELKDADRHMNLGRTMIERRLYDQARTEFEAAVKLDPERAEAHIELGLALIALGKHETALERLTKGLELDPESAPAHAGVGLVFLEQDQLDDAIDELEWALEINPRDAKTHYQLGLAYEKKGDQKEALRLYKRALDLVFKD